MSAATFLLDPEARRIYALTLAPRDRAELATALGMYPYTRLEVVELQPGVQGVPNANAAARHPGALVLVKTEPKARYENEAAVYRVAGQPVIGRALLAVREAGAAPLGQGLSAPTGFLKIDRTDEEIAALVEWEVSEPATDEEGTPYDAQALDAYLQMVCEAASKVLPTGGALRFVATDVHGTEAEAIAFLADDWRAMRRYCLDCFDRSRSVSHEFVVRNTAREGQASATEVLGAWAAVAKEREAGFRIDAPGGPVFARRCAARSRGIDTKATAQKTPRYPVPGVPVWGRDGRPVLVTWARCESAS